MDGLAAWRPMEHAVHRHGQVQPRLLARVLVMIVRLGLVGAAGAATGAHAGATEGKTCYYDRSVWYCSLLTDSLCRSACDKGPLSFVRGCCVELSDAEAPKLSNFDPFSGSLLSRTYPRRKDGTMTDARKMENITFEALLQSPVHHVWGLMLIVAGHIMFKTIEAMSWSDKVCIASGDLPPGTRLKNYFTSPYAQTHEPPDISEFTPVVIGSSGGKDETSICPYNVMSSETSGLVGLAIHKGSMLLGAAHESVYFDDGDLLVGINCRPLTDAGSSKNVTFTEPSEL